MQNLWPLTCSSFSPVLLQQDRLYQFLQKDQQMISFINADPYLSIYLDR